MPRWANQAAIQNATREFAEQFMTAIAMHVDEKYGDDLDENMVMGIEEELQRAIDNGLEAAYERVQNNE